MINLVILLYSFIFCSRQHPGPFDYCSLRIIYRSCQNEVIHSFDVYSIFHGFCIFFIFYTYALSLIPYLLNSVMFLSGLFISLSESGLFSLSYHALVALEQSQGICAACLVYPEFLSFVIFIFYYFIDGYLDAIFDICGRPLYVVIFCSICVLCLDKFL